MEYLGGAMYKEYFNELKRCIDLLDVNEIERIEKLIVNTIKNRGNIYIIGNGGSSSTASHYVVDFTKKLWIQEVTDEEVGSWINLEISKKLEIDKLYFDVKNQFDVLYKNMKVERNSKITLVLVGILVVTLVFNILNYFRLF